MCIRDRLNKDSIKYYKFFVKMYMDPHYTRKEEEPGYPAKLCLLGIITVVLAVLVIVHCANILIRLIDGGWSITLADIMVFGLSIVFALWKITNLVFAMLQVCLYPDEDLPDMKNFFVGSSIVILLYDAALVLLLIGMLIGGEDKFRAAMWIVLLLYTAYIVGYGLAYYHSMRYFAICMKWKIFEVEEQRETQSYIVVNLQCCLNESHLSLSLYL
eukprot:TRINITY_DN9455_c0_g4_i12.p1 TRINITY_DN9455_c0_g4~~TRINITY_DN9455_c0_g4_i12.p1  ORF type:complete len:215 (+),score=38.54 TRINITY_DN9455_c0_g4_i12:73-717(+)